MTDTIAVGDIAPAFLLPQDAGDPVSLAEYRGRKLVVYFYPKADTPGCTREAQAFSELAPLFARAKTAVLGVSADPIRKQQAFKKKYGLTIPLASDENHEMLVAFGVWGEKSMYGRTYMGIERATFLIDAEGRVARIWRKVKVEGHAEEVLAAAKAL